MGTRRHAFASMGRRAAALAACVALVAGLSPYAPARADEAAPQAPAAQQASAAVAASGSAAAQEDPEAASAAPAAASEPAGIPTAQTAPTAQATSSVPAAQALSALAQEEPTSPTGLEAQAQAASIVVKTAPVKTAYVEGQAFDPTGLVLTVTLTDGTTGEVAYTDDTKDSFSFAPTTLAATDTSVTIAYGGKTASLAITVEQAPVASIGVKAVPNKVAYFEGDTFDADGLIIAATYENGVTRDIFYSPTAGFSFDKSTLAYGDTSVTIAYGGKTASLAITVTQVQATEIVIMSKPHKVNYTVGDSFEAAGLVIMVYYNNNTSKSVIYGPTSGITLDKNVLAYNDTFVTIAYDGATIKLAITVSGTANYNKYIVPSPDEDKSTKDAQTKTLTINGVEVTATLTDSDKSIDGLAVAERASASDAITSALGGRTLQSDWDVSFTDGTTEGFGTLTLTFPASGNTVQVWEVHNGKLTKDADQAVSSSTASATTTTLSEFAVVSAPATAPATPAMGDGAALPAMPLAAAGAALAALAAARKRRTSSRR